MCSTSSINPRGYILKKHDLMSQTWIFFFKCCSSVRPDLYLGKWVDFKFSFLDILMVDAEMFGDG